MTSLPPPLELLPVAGLANRLRAIASGVCAAEEVGRTFTVSWTQQHSIHRGRPAQLFDLSATPFEIRDDDFGGPPPYPHKQILTAEDWTRFQEAAAATPIPRPMYIKSYGVFWQKDKERWLAALRSIRPAAHIESAVDRIMSQFSSWKPVGVHIRRTDNTKSIRESPTSAFRQAMNGYFLGTPFLVASDDPSERYVLAAEFPGCIYTGTPVELLTRDTEAGGQAAWVEFLCLSRCSEILGSAGSSFSELAAAYGGVPLRIIQDV